MLGSEFDPRLPAHPLCQQDARNLLGAQRELQFALEEAREQAAAADAARQEVEQQLASARAAAQDDKARGRHTCTGWRMRSLRPCYVWP